MEDANTSLDESDETDASVSDDSWSDYFDLEEGGHSAQLSDRFPKNNCIETEVEVDGSIFRPAYYRKFCKQFALREKDSDFESTYVLTRDVS